MARGAKRPPAARPPSPEERAWLARGLDQPGGKLPLFDDDGQRVDARLVSRCLAAGWAAPWFSNPLKPDWQVCRLTDAGRLAASAEPQSADSIRIGRAARA